MINTFKLFQNLPIRSKILTTSSYYFANLKFPLPDLGEKIKEGTVKKLYVKEGDVVEQFQKIADVESDKQFTEITAPEVGKISRIYYQESQVCKVGDLFMEIQTDAAQPTNQQKKATQPKQQASKKQPQNISTGQERPKRKRYEVNWSEEILASPVVRIFAYNEGVDIMKVKGSGKRGRILKGDIIAFQEGHQKEVPSNPISKIGKRPIPENRTIKMNAYQTGMQKSMTQSNKVPHLYYFESVDITETESMRKVLKKNNMKITLMGILTKTLSMAIKQVPQINSTYKLENEFQYKIHSNHNISLAIDSPNGLVAPNIKNVENLSILDIQKELENLKILSEKAQLNKTHLQNGTICLSNIGTIGGVSACPLILCPQVCIIAIGKIIEKPFYHQTTISKKKQITFGFGCDHRVLDGATVARFSNEWKKILENPYIALAKMH